MKLTFGQFGHDILNHPGRYSDQIVVEPTATLRLRLDYPLDHPVLFERTHEDGSPWTKRQLVEAVRDAYREVYGAAAHDQSLPLPENVWGHSIGNLILDEAERGPDGVWVLVVGS